MTMIPGRLVFHSGRLAVTVRPSRTFLNWTWIQYKDDGEVVMVASSTIRYA